MPDTSAPASTSREMRWRHRFSIISTGAVVLLIAMGGFVTSINAGLAVPDWPTSFGSMNPFYPMPEWWKITPILAEHGHRLMGALVGILTTVLAVWTWRSDARPWMRKLAGFALALVIFQGVLGGLRVIWVSLDLAVVHACTAQLFFATLLAMTIFTAPSWRKQQPLATTSRSSLPALACATAGMLYLQIIFGALLRHPGEGIDPTLAFIHIGGAMAALGLILATGISIQRQFPEHRLLQRHRQLLYGLVALQITLGLVAYLVLLDETGRLVRPSTMQVVVNTTHLVVGSLLFGTAVSLVLWVVRPMSEPAVSRSDTTLSTSSTSQRTQLA